MKKSELWIKLAIEHGVDGADAIVNELYDAYRLRFEVKDMNNPPSWREIEQGCLFDNMPIVALYDEDGVYVSIQRDGIGYTFHVPVGFSEVQKWWDANSKEILEQYVEQIHYDEDTN